MQSAEFAVGSVQCSVHSVQCAVYVYCRVCRMHNVRVYSVYIVQYTECSVCVVWDLLRSAA